MENQTIAQKLEALVLLQSIDTKLDQLLKLRGDLPNEIQDLEDEIEGYKIRKTRFETELNEMENLVKQNKEGIIEATRLVKKYSEQQNNVKNNREFDAIAKEIELQELEIEICEKRVKEFKDKIEAKKVEIDKVELLISSRNDDADEKRKELLEISEDSSVEETKLHSERIKASKKIEPKLLKYYERLRKNLSNGLAVVRVVRGAAEGCNIIIPPQKIAEIKEMKKIVIDEHSGRILADVEVAPELEKSKSKARKTARKKSVVKK